MCVFHAVEAALLPHDAVRPGVQDDQVGCHMAVVAERTSVDVPGPLMDGVQCCGEHVVEKAIGVILRFQGDNVLGRGP